MGTHLYDSFHSLERMLEGHQELSKDVLKKFGGHVQCNGCKVKEPNVINETVTDINRSTSLSSRMDRFMD